VYIVWGRALGPFKGLSTGQLMLPAPHGRKEGGKGSATISATNLIGHSKTISATTENNIGHMENPSRLVM